MRVLPIAVIVVVVATAVGAPVTAQQGTSTLTVSVVDQNGDPVGGADLDATWDSGSRTTTTASNGKAFVDVPSGADVRIDVAHPDYVRNRPKQVLDAGEEDVTVEVAPKAYATVRTATGAGEAIDARVIVRNTGGDVVMSGAANGSGVFTTGAIEEGEYSITVRKSGYFRNATDLQVSGETTVRFTLEQGSVPVRFDVRDDHFSPPRPVEGATVTVDGVGSAKTLGSGETSLQAPVNSRLAVEVTKSAYGTVEQTVEVGERAQRVNVTIQRRPALNVSATNEQVVVGERVRLEVTDQYGAPVANASVTVDGEPVGETGDDGTASVLVERAGEHTVRATLDSITSGPAVVRGVVPAGTDTATATATERPGDSGGLPVSQPGFTPAIAVLALVAFALVAVRLRSTE